MGKYSFDAVIFDLDGVITKTALVHAASWKKTFDEYLQKRVERDGEAFVEFTQADYLSFVDGKPRYNGVKSFLKSRDISLPMGEPSDKSDVETCCGIGNRKNDMFRIVLDEEGVDLYQSTIDFVKDLHANGIRVGVASSSKNCQTVLQRGSVEELFETRVDGVVSTEMGLKGKPEGDIFVTAARNLGVLPYKAVVVEDAKSGVQAGRNGGFGLVIGVAREENAAKLMRNGADLVVRDMKDISINDVEAWFNRTPKPLFEAWKEAEKNPHPKKKKSKKTAPIMVSPNHFRTPQSALTPQDKRLVIFINYDGTLTHIQEKTDQAFMTDEMRDALYKVSRKHTVAILSSRQREDLERLVGIEDLFYVGSYGFDISAPGFSMVYPKVKKIMPVISEVADHLQREIGAIEGAHVESKKYNIGVHYRLVEESRVEHIKAVLDQTLEKYPSLRMTASGKKAFEILPNLDWGKGSAIGWVMKTIKLAWSKASVVYIGDDITDEFAFRMIRTRGIGITVSNDIPSSAAHFQISTPEDVQTLLHMINDNT